MNQPELEKISAEVAEAARQEIFREVVRPAFLTKLSRDWGIQPRNEAELRQYETIAEQLVRGGALQAKQAAEASGNPVLDEIIGGLESNLGVASHEQTSDAGLQKAASIFIEHNPQLVDAASKFAGFVLANNA